MLLLGFALDSTSPWAQGPVFPKPSQCGSAQPPSCPVPPASLSEPAPTTLTGHPPGPLSACPVDPAWLFQPNQTPGPWCVLTGQHCHLHAPADKIPLLPPIPRQVSFSHELCFAHSGVSFDLPQQVEVCHTLNPLEWPLGKCGITEFREIFNFQLFSGGFVSKTLSFPIPVLPNGSSLAEAAQLLRVSGTPYTLVNSSWLYKEKPSPGQSIAFLTAQSRPTVLPSKICQHAVLTPNKTSQGER